MSSLGLETGRPVVAAEPCLNDVCVKPARPKSEWVQILLIAFAGLAISGAVRGVFAYPWCSNGNDELFWGVILEQRTSGGALYPISGAAFVWLLEIGAPALGLNFASAISILGAISVPMLLLLAYLVYRCWCFDLSPILLLGLLATTVYFLAPLLESKPQQWGQFLVLAGAWLGCSALRGTGRWRTFMLCALALAAVHILSFAILAALTGITWLLFLAAGLSRLRDGGRLGLALIPGSVFVLWPQGPYAVLWQVVFAHRLIDPALTLWVSAGLAVLLLLAWLAGWRLRSNGRNFQMRPRSGDCAARPSTLGRLPWWLLMLPIAVCLALQAWMLPADYWNFYRNSLWNFLFAQAGNLLFLYLVVRGLSLTWTRARVSTLPSYLVDCAALLVAAGAIGLFALAFTALTTDNNWFLRVANFAVLFAVPFAAIALKGNAQRLRAAHFGLVAAAVTISLLLAIRWPGLYFCY